MTRACFSSLQVLLIGSLRNQRIIHWQCYMHTEANPRELTFDLSYWEVQEIEILKKWEGAKPGFEHHDQICGSRSSPVVVWPLFSMVGASHGVNLIASFPPWTICPSVCDYRLTIMAFLLLFIARSLMPSWEEVLLFNEIFSYFLSRQESDPKVIMFFEVRVSRWSII